MDDVKPVSSNPVPDLPLPPVAARTVPPVGPGTKMAIIGFAGSVILTIVGAILIITEHDAGEQLLWAGMSGMTLNGVGALGARSYQQAKMGG